MKLYNTIIIFLFVLITSNMHGMQLKHLQKLFNHSNSHISFKTPQFGSSGLRSICTVQELDTFQKFRMDANYVHLLQWVKDPKIKPSTDQITSMLESLNFDKQQTMFNQLEAYKKIKNQLAIGLVKSSAFLATGPLVVSTMLAAFLLMEHDLIIGLAAYFPITITGGALVMGSFFVGAHGIEEITDALRHENFIPLAQFKIKKNIKYIEAIEQILKEKREK